MSVVLPKPRQDAERDAVVRLLSIGLRRYTCDPLTRSAATKHILLNALRLALLELAPEEVAQVRQAILSAANPPRPMRRMWEAR